eukprot:2767883-Amphidinium_carterae.2
MYLRLNELADLKALANLVQLRGVIQLVFPAADYEELKALAKKWIGGSLLRSHAPSFTAVLSLESQCYTLAFQLHPYDSFAAECNLPNFNFYFKQLCQC